MIAVKDQIRVRPKSKRRFSTLLEGLLYLLPSILLFAVFLFYPMFKTIYLSLFLTDAQGNTQTFVGLEHYIQLFQSTSFLSSLKATVLFVLYTVPAGVLLALGLALLANQKLKGIGFFRTIFSSTMGMSVAASSVIWLFIYNPTIGIANTIIKTFGMTEMQWLLNPDTALLSVALPTIWMNTGFSFLILLGGLHNIDSSLYESGKIAGVGDFYSLRKITLPLLSPTLLFIVTVSLINSFQTFGQIDILTKGGPMESTNVIVYSIFKDAFVNFNIGSASAQAVILFTFILAVTILQFKWGEKKVHYQ
ncbi:MULTISPECIES: carbohydrate ABC transporter permease [Sporosarcina]|uniref:carbohydrate ABC transporter permease n=1 Tax=Sporosarcina TaxID=1569 RepID=UPI00129BA62E|nr:MULTISPECIES: sugar ABC transporter permease [Sporosarcina]GKV66131.1 glycerol-3-phosphate ABC transporter permease [Sporosarcina sp. NCCP-2331]GLB56111.1 glycerol-3-phosphate ABC transporter permease [Sporosarcina sp. NCCP-2378]